VDVIEAGFRRVLQRGFRGDPLDRGGRARKARVFAGARQRARHLQGGEALASARSKRIHTFIATSPLHMEKKLRMSPDQVFEQARQAVRLARRFTGRRRVLTEDGSRSELDFLCRVIEAAITEGATTINIPDTVGYAVPEQYGRLLRELRERVPNSDRAGLVGPLPQRPGNGRGQFAGRRVERRAADRVHDQRSGERAGNTSLEEVVMAVKTRHDVFVWRSGSTPRRSFPAPSSYPTSRAFRSSPTRPWWAPTRLRTPRAFTRTGC